MAYFSQAGAMHGSHWSGEYVPAAKVTRVVCNACAETEVAWGPSRMHGEPTHCWPWKWAPYYGTECDCCSKPA